MLKLLSYFNIFFAVFYFMEYLQNSSYWITSGVIAVIVSNWLVLRWLESGVSGNRWVSVAVALGSISYAVYTAFNTLTSLYAAVAEDYLDRPLILLSAATIVFAVTIIAQLLISGFNQYSKKSD
ncbi:hypothetical protein N180_10830 [Pedobacter antarcticus 4BY]|uniref:Uncharacterized protein n=2 Tax=Pedobacter antarcticus TaxID=34086 RepID=A0A081PLA3_9SPHI|nr:hypothetical protein [Pedobacter antarcticus]KEQ31476.1 hypothetical protein N180_10830 [Pedobacter antarcticus 4BY]SFE74549.1 hypothetical protein SAMN03003324_01307 [Pedobacter antarcticus]